MRHSNAESGDLLDTPEQFEFLMRVTRVRQVYPRFTIVSALVVSDDGTPVPRAPNYSVVIPTRLTPLPMCQGQRWRLTGTPQPVEFETRDGWRVQEMRFTAASALLERTSGAHIVSLLCSEQFPGIGPVTAQRAWDTLGESLYKALDTADHDTLVSVVGPKNVQSLIAGWTYYCNSDLLKWMQSVNLDVRVGRKVLKVYGRDALEKLLEDPYRLLALGLSWQSTDVIATTHMSIAADDPRRLSAIVESELYLTFDKGDTYTTHKALTNTLNRRLDVTLTDTAIDIALRSGVLLASGERLFSPGPYLLERAVCDSIVARLEQSEPLFEPVALEQHIDAFEKAEQERSGVSAFHLNDAQRQAVRKASSHDFFCVIGGAGVGKTTTLNAIVYLLDMAQRPVYLLAPTGKASKRMRQATRRSAMTISGFLRNILPKGLPESCVVVIDESSMLDIQLAYQLFTGIPSETRLILIGDSAQLPPVGPGLTLHVISNVPAIPVVELTEGKRFAGRIARLAQDIRCGVWHDAPADPEQEVSFIQCSAELLPQKVMDLYLRDPLNSQVLCCTKTSGAAPTRIINELCQAQLGESSPRLLVYSEDRERLEDTGLRQGDPVICTTNLWDHDLQNGSIGRVEHIESPPLPQLDEAGTRVGMIYAWVIWDDGERRPVTDVVLDALELAYAITVHKSQGSEVPVVVVPVYRTRNLDRTMLYTAVTRAKQKVILVGDADIARAAVEAEPHAARRRVMLGDLLSNGKLRNV